MAGSDELRRLEADLGKIPGKAVPEVEKVLKKGATNLKRDMQAEFAKSKWFARVGRSVSYDRRGLFGSIGYEVGPTVGGAGSLAGVAVDGGANGGGGSVDIDTPAQAEADRIEEYLDKAIEDLL